jgi:large subunit ribosomal protein L33
LREIVVLACQKCKRRNYTYTKNRQKHPDRLEYKKYCRFCNAHTVHKQTR